MNDKNHFHFHLFNIISEEGAWPMELDDTWCLTEYGNGWATSVASQLDCQDICLENPFEEWFRPILK